MGCAGWIVLILLGEKISLDEAQDVRQVSLEIVVCDFVSLFLFGNSSSCHLVEPRAGLDGELFGRLLPTYRRCQDAPSASDKAQPDRSAYLVGTRYEPEQQLISSWFTSLQNFIVVG
jgi:hypothetical protein